MLNFSKILGDTSAGCDKFLLEVKSVGLGSPPVESRGKAPVGSLGYLRNTILFTICSYVTEMYATYFLAEFDVVEVQTAKLWQLNSIIVKLALCFRSLGSKSSNTLDLTP